MRPMIFAPLAAAALALSTAAFAMGGSSNDNAPKAANADYTRAKAMVEAGDYQNALPLLQQVVTKEPKNADAYNLIGYSLRKSGNAQGSLQYYQHALSLDPRHLGANEYIGEAYLMLGRVAEAEQHLSRLDQLCTFGCVEQRTLKTAIADYKAGKRPTN